MQTKYKHNLQAKKRACIALSGGVDSAVAAYLMQKEGYDVFGLTMDLLDNPSIKDASLVADKLGIEHHFIDLRHEFNQHVISYFAKSYTKGLTPSPCIVCNKEIKLGLFAQKAFDMGADLIVTGHYANIIHAPEDSELHRATDLNKDQSYFLFAIKQDILERLSCPLANLSKEQTRALALEAGLEIHNKSDSQDICFVQDGKYAELIAKFDQNASTPGNIVDTKGKILGQHNGIINYTVGQRRGLGIGGGDIFYVTKIDAKNNCIIVGSKDELIRKKIKLCDVNWLSKDKPQKIELMVKLRSRQNLIPAIITFLEDNFAEVELLEDFYGVAPGQGCCFYQGTRVLGGGFIM